MFADDTKLFRTVKSINDCNILQNDLNTLKFNGLMIGDHAHPQKQPEVRLCNDNGK